MLKKILLLSPFLFLSIILCTHKSADSRPTIPPFESTGGPGQQTCARSGCHAGSQNNNTASLQIFFDEPELKYEAGVTYDMSVTVMDATKIKWGFQMVAFNTNNESTGAFLSDSNPPVIVRLDNNTNIEYVSHFIAPDCNFADCPEEGQYTFPFQWTAPTSGVFGDIAFYAASMAANANNSPTGDALALNNLTITPKNVSTPPLMVHAKILLEGSYLNNGLMHTNLASNLPTIQPFDSLPWNYMGTEQINGIPAGTTDWLLVELWNDLTAPNPIAQQAVLVREDGVLIDVAGNEGIGFTGIPDGNYFLLIRHRNHLDVMTSNAIALPNTAAQRYDFTTAPTQALGTNQLVDLADGRFALKAGDIDGNGIVSVNDFNTLQEEIGTNDNYAISDLNGDQEVTVDDFNVYQNNASAIGVTTVRY